MTPTDNEFYEAYKKSASFCDDLYQKEREKTIKVVLNIILKIWSILPFQLQE